MTDLTSTIARVVELQRQIHANPELGFDTFETSALVAEELRDSGVAVREGVGRTGVVGDIEVLGAKRRIALRADMDALPMDEDNDLPHKSRNPGAAHLCGHDAHTAMLLGAARVLASDASALPCSIRFLFQPNEEQPPGGAPAMIEDGCLVDVDRVFGMHVWPSLPTGQLGVHVGPTMARPDNFAIHLRGVGGHAAAPHKNRDVLVAAAQITTALQSIVSRNLDPLDSGVLSVTRLIGGTADNVIPETAFVGGTIRSFRTEVADTLRRRMEEVANGIAAAMEVEASIDYLQGYPVVVNDTDACDEAEAAVGTNIPVTRDVDPTLGGEDFAYYQEQVPGAFLFLGNYDESQGIVHFCHHPRFRVDDQAMAHGVRTWVDLARNARPQ